MPLPLRLKIRLAIVIASLCIPILFLLVTMIPGVPMFETSFVYLPSTLHIDGVDVSGVTQISWGIWKACYSSNVNKTMCTASHWITNPYTFTISGDTTGFANQVTVEQSWLNSLFLHFVAIFYAISIGLFHFVRYFHNRILSMKKTNFLTLSFCGWMTIILITDYAVLRTIAIDMQLLSQGGIITNPVSGFWLTVTAYLLTLVFLFLTWCYPFQERSSKIRSPPERGLPPLGYEPQR